MVSLLATACQATPLTQVVSSGGVVGCTQATVSTDTSTGDVSGGASTTLRSGSSCPGSGDVATGLRSVVEINTNYGGALCFSSDSGYQYYTAKVDTGATVSAATCGTNCYFAVGWGYVYVNPTWYSASTSPSACETN